MMAATLELEARLKTRNQPEEDQGPRKILARKWCKEWVTQDTVWNNGKCVLLKWVTEETLNALKAKQAEGEQAEAEEEHEVVYLCTSDGCGKVFSDSSSLRKHAHVHGEKQYICHYEGCGKRFMDSSKLKRHNLIHTGEKHFMCPFEGCGKAFSLPFNLRTHVRTHTGENYHRCPYEDCPKRYAHEYKLKKHMRVHHEKRIPMSIKPEGVQVEREQAPPKLISTTQVVSPSPATLDRPFVCPYEGCGKRYKHVYKLNLHLKGVHAEEEQQREERASRGSEGEEDVDNSSDRDPTFNDRGKGSGKGKLKVPTKAPASKRKRPAPAKPPPPDKRQATSSSSRKKKPASRQPAAEAADSEDTVDEEAEEKAPPTGVLRTQILEDDREGQDESDETEDDVEY